MGWRARRDEVGYLYDCIGKVIGLMMRRGLLGAKHVGSGEMVMVMQLDSMAKEGQDDDVGMP
jgi:hypothetical protein